MERKYWESTGRFQKEYNEMQEAMYRNEFAYNKQELEAFHRYKRFYNLSNL